MEYRLSKKLSRRVGMAMADYSMLDDGDRVLVAVSGGVDSSVLAWLLGMWRGRAPITYHLHCVYIDSGFWAPAQGGRAPGAIIAEMLAPFDLEFSVVQAPRLAKEELNCFLCSRNRRTLLFDCANRWNMNKIAFGHHMDDLVETLYLNMLYSGNISTMVPKQQLFAGKLDVIRPMAYLEKKDVRAIASALGLQPIANGCTMEKDSRRATVRDILADIYAREPRAKRSIFRSLSNVRGEYLLKES